jgi:hypothetical protein
MGGKGDHEKFKHPHKNDHKHTKDPHIMLLLKKIKKTAGINN